jgi:hypothetical protein
MAFRVLADTLLRWRAAGAYGAAVKAESSGAYERAHALARQALDTIERTADRNSPGSVAIWMTSVALLDKVAGKLGQPAPHKELEEALVLAQRYEGTRKFDEYLRWLNHRLADLRSKSS